MWDLKPKTELTEQEVQRGMRMVIWDGLTAEVMTSFTEGAFLISMALLLGASNLEIGILAALPMFTNVFQLISIWLVRRFNNRRAVAVFSAFLARVPLLVIGFSALISSEGSIDFLIFFLFFYYVFGSIAGPSWNSWMKDLIPEKKLGDYFSRRGKYTQILNIVLSIILAFILDFIRNFYPEWELNAYAVFFIIAGITGIIGGFLLARAPEPQSYLSQANILALFKLPLKNENFRKLLVFSSMWVLALNMATPFFIVFMMKSMSLGVSYVIILGTISQLFSILTIRMWGVLSDRYSNKSIISISAPLYILCIIGWCFVGIYTRFYLNIALLVVIHIVSGIATAGINLSTTNIGIKLAPREDAIVYLSVKNIITAIFSSIGPLIGGLLADFFADRTLSVTARWMSPDWDQTVRLVVLHEWTFLFLIGALMAIVSLNLLKQVKEEGEVGKDVVRRIMRTRFKTSLKEYFIVGNIVQIHQQLKAIVKKPTKAAP